MKKFLLTIYLLTLSFSANAEKVIMDKDDF